MVMERGDVVWTDFGPSGGGSAAAGLRPSVIVQRDDLNRSGISTVLVVPVTSNTGLRSHMGNVFLPRQVGGLHRDSVANVSLTIAVDRHHLVGQVGRLPAPIMDEVDAGLRLVLDV